MLGFLVASSIGAVLGILFAPQAGSETRTDLAERGRQLAWRLKRGRAELQENVREIFGKITDELEEAYLEVRDDVLRRLDELESDADVGVYRRNIRSAVMAAARGRHWTRAQIERFIRHLEDEYTSDMDENV